MAMKKKTTEKSASKKKVTKKAAPKQQKAAPRQKPAKKKTTKKSAPKKKAATKRATTKRATTKAAAPRRTKGAATELTKAESKENLHLLIGRAITDRRFRGLVTKNPARVLALYPMLAPEKNAVLKAVKNPMAAAKAIDQLIDDTVGPVGAI